MTESLLCLGALSCAIMRVWRLEGSENFTLNKLLFSYPNDGDLSGGSFFLKLRRFRESFSRLQQNYLNVFEV